jgi:ATP-binding cassette subfamily C (CFTR/MRP) protein 1
MILMSFVAYVSPIVSPILAFTVFSVLAAKSNGASTLDTAKVFTSLSLFTLLAEPLSSLIVALSSLMGGVGSFKRIQEFIAMDARVEKRKFPSMHGSIASTLSIDTNSEKNSEVSEKDDKGGSSNESTTEVNSLGDQAVVIENGTFGWDKDEASGTLQGVNLIVPRGKITMVVGPVGCGKSTLLKGLLGETLLGGTLQLSSLRIALCDQTAWHVNGTVQQSICGPSAYDLRWYSSVVRSCALDEDLRLLPQGDQTQIGSKGIALSGGQSQRIVSRPAFAPPYTPHPLIDVFIGACAGDICTKRHCHP